MPEKPQSSSSAPETWINVVIIVTEPLAPSAEPASVTERAQKLGAEFAADPRLVLSITADDQRLQAKIQYPLALDAADSSEQQRQKAAEAAARDLGRVPCQYYWEEIDSFGELRQQGAISELSATDLAPEHK
jgi:hypothetical protein